MKALSVVMFCLSTTFGVSVFASSLKAAPIMQIQSAPSTPNAAVMGDQYLSYYFGRVYVNSRQSVTYRLTNTGTKPLTIKQITIEGMAYDANEYCPAVLEVNKSCDTDIYFWPPFTSSYSGRLVWYTDDGNIILDLWGDGVR